MNIKDKVIEILKKVYDPEFPFADIWTLGMIYDVQVDEESREINILMTLTTPMCPMQDSIMLNVKNSIVSELNERNVNVDITFDPPWSIDMIKDEEIKKMFL